MTIPTWAAAFADGISKIPAIFLNNYVRTQLPKCLDGVGGNEGVPSTPATKIQIYGAGLELGGATPYLQYESGSVPRTQTGLLANLTTGAVAPGNITIGATQSGTQTLDRVPDGATITGFTVYHNRIDLGSLPTTRVTVALRKRNITTGAGSAISGPTEDPTNTLAAYEAHHAITITGLSEVVDSTTTVYYLDFQGETGSNTSSTVLYACLVTYTITKQDKAP